MLGDTYLFESVLKYGSQEELSFLSKSLPVKPLNPHLLGRTPILIIGNSDMVFSLEGTKLLLRHDRTADGLPELQPLHIGRERVYYITMFSKPELISYDIRTGRQLCRSTLPEKVNNRSRYPQFHFISDMDYEFLAYVSQDLSPSYLHPHQPTSFWSMALMAIYPKKIEISDVCGALEFKETTQRDRLCVRKEKARHH